MSTTDLPVIVYTPGRAATHTVANTLNHHGILNVNQHSIPETELSQSKMKHGDVEDVWYRRYVARRMVDLARGKVRLKVISLVREPIEMMCSMLFRNLNVYTPQLVNLPDEQMFEGIVKYLHDRLISADPNIAPNAMCPFYVDRWFDNELNKLFEFDIFTVSVDRNADFQIFETKHADILMIKVERLSDCFQQALSSFLGQPITQLHICNLARQKANAQIYCKTKKSLKIPLSNLEYIYSNSRFIQNFYSHDQIAGFIQKWVDEPMIDVAKNKTAYQRT